MEHNLRTKILIALEEKKIFIGYYMLCRYLNGKGYVRHGCNAGYNARVSTKGNDRLNPCKILCPNSNIYNRKVSYHCEKLRDEGKLFLEKRLWIDSVHPRFYRKHHRMDMFVIIAVNYEYYKKWISENEPIMKKKWMDSLQEEKIKLEEA